MRLRLTDWFRKFPLGAMPGGSAGLRRMRGFTLLEMLAVLAIIGVMAGLALPHWQGFKKSNSMQAATRQLLDDVAFARQRALADHTTVYMVFLGTNEIAQVLPSMKAYTNAQGMLPNQLQSYALLSLRTAGDQPGRWNQKYITPWRKLPDGVYFPLEKFRNTVTVVDPGLPDRVIDSFDTMRLPFPSVTAGTNVTLPYIKFTSTGQCPQTAAGHDQYIPLTRGSVMWFGSPPLSVVETPAGESTNNYTLIHIDPMTGRSRLERKEIH